MRQLIVIILVSLSFSVAAQVEVVKWKQYVKIQNAATEKVKVINFWATWCGPCVKELPLFEVINDSLSEQVEVILVSLDNKQRLDEKVNPFVARKQIKSKVVLLDDIDFNSWMPKINGTWQGEIPVTLVINKGKQKFHRGEITKEKLLEMIKEVK